jgi:hypothetical protein
MLCKFNFKAGFLRYFGGSGCSLFKQPRFLLMVPSKERKKLIMNINISSDDDKWMKESCKSMLKLDGGNQWNQLLQYHN